MQTQNEKKNWKRKKSELIEIDSKYYQTEKQSNEDLENSKNKLKSEIDKIKQLINSQKNDDAIKSLDDCQFVIEEYADSYSKNQNIKRESVKRNERIAIIDKEIESWKNLLSNSEKMVAELSDRKINLMCNEINLIINQNFRQKKGQISENLRISENEKMRMSKLSVPQMKKLIRLEIN